MRFDARTQDKPGLFDLVRAGALSSVFAALVVAVTLSAVAALINYAPAMVRRAKLGSSYVIGMTASFWFIQRVIGL